MSATPVTILGASGFVGRHLLARLRADGVPCDAPTRDAVSYTHLTLPTILLV